VELKQITIIIIIIIIIINNNKNNNNASLTEASQSLHSAQKSVTK